MPEGDDGGELDVVPLDDAVPPPDTDAPVRRLPGVLRRRWRAIAVVLGVCLVVGAVYVAVAVTGVRHVESGWHRALALRDRYDEHVAATLRPRSDLVAPRPPRGPGAGSGPGLRRTSRCAPAPRRRRACRRPCRTPGP